ncbi:MAG TPA: hypothetical protein VG298_05465 [Acidimicrobiales bacterium]|nr:hypothetical protein [Acidimicrobiales bacterium]
MRSLAELMFWWAAGLGIWMLTLSSVSAAELAVAMPSALLCAGVAVGGRRALGARWRPEPVWLRWFVLLPVAVAVDSVRVVALVVRTGGRTDAAGSFRTYSVRPRPGTGRQDAWDAVAVLAVSATPGSFVVDVDTTDDGSKVTMLTHSLSSGKPDMAEAVGR